ncbi:hypothetical protein QFC21_006149 [Naganishia friedmannii]|uniref:Uncharacterized protein n=1 Tax=Naganishia friedmannii TaxID=89922 RepID=A0ACC2V4M0_9TREE|nr:hypothetical protein QFC21_006149 [Naganishia friedmannii]
MFWHNTNDIFCETTAPKVVMAELKALLVSNKDTLTHFSFQPLRTVTWRGSVISYKITPLLADNNGCIAIRMPPTLMSTIIEEMQKDEDILVIESKAKLFQVESVPKYRIQLHPDSSAATSPLPSPNVSMLRLQYFNPVHQRIDPESAASRESTACIEKE